MLIVACCLAVFGGLVLARRAAFVDVRWLFLLVPFVVFSLRRHNLATLILLAILFGGLGWWRGSVYMQKLAVHQSLQHHKVTLVGHATDDAVYGQRYQLEFTLSDVRVVSPRLLPLVGNVTVRGFGEPAINRGDVVEVQGTLFPTRGNNLASVSFARLKVVQHDSFWINRLRRKFAAGMQSALPEPVASFGLGLLIGQRSTLPQENADQLRHVGLTHIIAVSGYNLTVIVLACRRLFVKRSKFQATFICLALIGLFLLLTGSSPPIVRAAIVSLLSIASWYYGRAIKPIALILLAAALTALANPLYLWGNVSWYLSFLAFFGVLVVAPLLTKRLFGDKEPGVLLGILLESACASLVVLPYILFIFGETSLISLVANVLVIPFIPLAMLLSLGAGLVGSIIPALAGWLAWPANWVLTYMLDIANLLGRIPHAYVSNIGFPVPYMLTAYLIIGFVCLILWSKTHKSDMITEKIQESSE